MQANIGDIFKAIGPAASIIFAAWIFVSFQVRYYSAMSRYLDAIQQCLSKKLSDMRLGLLMEEILTYRRRCALINVASSIGFASAITLVSTLIVGELALVFPTFEALTYVAIALGLVGLLLIIAAALSQPRLSSCTKDRLFTGSLSVSWKISRSWQARRLPVRVPRRGASGPAS